MDIYHELPNTKLLDNEEFENLLISCNENKITTIDFLTLNSIELSKLLNRSINEINNFKLYLKNEFDENYLNNNNNIAKCKKKSFFTTGDSQIDDLLNGGIYTNQFTEIFGESSTGKSQFLFQLSLSCQLPKNLNGLDGSCVFITTENDLPTERINQIIENNSIFKEYSSISNILTVYCNDLTSQDHIINIQLPILIENYNKDNKKKIKLIIIDSISHHIRAELLAKNFKEAQNNRNYLDNLAEFLLNLSNKFNLAIVLSNQISDKPIKYSTKIKKLTDYDYQLGYFVGWNNNSLKNRQLQLNNNDNINTINNNKKIETKIPNLGITWANHISTRILLKKYYKKNPNFINDSDDNFWKTYRILKVVFDNNKITNLDSNEINFIVNKSGINSIIE